MCNNAKHQSHNEKRKQFRNKLKRFEINWNCYYLNGKSKRFIVHESIVTNCIYLNDFIVTLNAYFAFSFSSSHISVGNKITIYESVVDSNTQSICLLAKHNPRIVASNQKKKSYKIYHLGENSSWKAIKSHCIKAPKKNKLHETPWNALFYLNLLS